MTKKPTKKVTKKKKKLPCFEVIIENPFMLSIITSAVIVGLFILVGSYDSGIKTFGIDDTNENFTPVELCSKIQGTPSWINSTDGEIIAEGYLNFANGSEIVNKELIPLGIIFIYHSGCGYCNEQIKSFGTAWQDYVDSNLTIDCSQV